MVGDRQLGEVHWLRQENSSGQPVLAGFWRCGPMTFEYEFPGDEMFCVVQGSVVIRIEGSGDSLRLSQGDIATFDKGTRTVWTIESPFRNFFVVDNC